MFLVHLFQRIAHSHVYTPFKKQGLKLQNDRTIIDVLKAKQKVGTKNGKLQFAVLNQREFLLIRMSGQWRWLSSCQGLTKADGRTI